MSRLPPHRLAVVAALAVLAGGCVTPGARRAKPVPAPHPAPAPHAAPAPPPAPGAAPAPRPPPRTAPAPAPTGPDALLAPCLPRDRSADGLRDAMDAAFDHRDARCWSAREIALAEALLAAAKAAHPGAGPLDDDALQRAAWHFRQAEIRANRFGDDDLAAVADLGRARVAMAVGDAKATVFHLGRAVRAAGRDAAATGDARPALDGIFVTDAIEALAQWERTHDRSDLDDALAAVTRLQGREALRAFRARGVTPARLATAAGLPDAARRLAAFATLTRRLRAAWGPAERTAAPGREAAAEAVVQSGPAWIAAAPSLLDWLPGDVAQIVGSTQAVLAPGEVLLDYAVGRRHGILFVITDDTVDARPLPGRARLEAEAKACAAAPTPGASGGPGADPCAALRADVLGPAGAPLARARQILVAAQGIVHRVPFERLLGPRPVVRVPSALALTGLRLRAWGQGPAAHPAAAALVPGAAPPVVDAGPAPGALAPLRAALAAGATEVTWRAPDRPDRRYGVPLTVPPAAAPAGPQGAD